MSIEVRVNGILLPIEVRDIEGRGPVAVETTTSVVPGRHGSIPVRKRLPSRPLNIDFTMKGVTRDKIEELSRILVTGLEVPITFSDEPNRTYYGFLNGEPDWEEIRVTGLGMLPFTRQPFKYGAEKTYTGLRVTNGGTYETSPIIKATFASAASEYKISDSTGKFVRVTFGFVAGDVLTIDLEKRKVTINGNLQMGAYDWKSRPFALRPGVNDLTATTAGTPRTEITFRERWV